VDDFDLETLADNDLFVDAVVTATRTVEHTHQKEKISALRNAVLNSVRVIQANCSLCQIYPERRRAHMKDDLFLERMQLPHNVLRNRSS